MDSRKLFIMREIFGDVKMLPSFRLLGNVTRHDFQTTNTPRGTLATRLCSWGRPRTDRSRERTTAAAPAQIVTSWPPLPRCVCMAWDDHRSHSRRQDRPSRCRRDDSRPDDGADDRPHAGRRGWTQAAGRTIAGTDAQPVRGAHRAAQRTHSPRPSGLRRT